MVGRTSTRRLLLLTALAALLGFAGGGAAWVLLRLITLITNAGEAFVQLLLATEDAATEDSAVLEDHFRRGEADAHILELLAYVQPRCPWVTTKLASPRAPRAGSTDRSTWTSAMPPLVTNVLEPLGIRSTLTGDRRRGVQCRLARRHLGREAPSWAMNAAVRETRSRSIRSAT
jgi:hypothetical protein